MFVYTFCNCPCSPPTGDGSRDHLTDELCCGMHKLCAHLYCIGADSMHEGHSLESCIVPLLRLWLGEVRMSMLIQAEEGR